MTDRQKMVFTILIVVLLLILLLAIAEGSVRLRQWWSDGHSGQITDLFETRDGLRMLRPGASTRTLEINSLGFRGPEIMQPRPEGVTRIAFVGASTTFCAEVSANDKAWPDLVVQALNAGFPAHRFDYVNAAVPGYTVRTSLENFKRRVAPLEPDVTIIYHATNDLSWETRDLAIRQGIYTDPRKTERSWLARHSLLWYLVEKNISIKRAQRQASENAGRLDFDAGDLGEVFRQQLTGMVREAMRVSDRVVLLTFSHRLRSGQAKDEQLEAAASALYYMPFMNPDKLIAAFDRYNAIIAEVAQETGAMLIAGEELIPADAAHFNDTVHFTDAGSRIMARRVSQALAGDSGFRALLRTEP